MADHPDERRTTMRIQAVWQRLAKDRIPGQAEIDPKQFGADWSSCLVIQIDGGTARLRAHCETGLDHSISQPLAETLLTLAQRHIPRALTSGEPVGYGGIASHEGKDILYRMVLLPLAEDGANIDALLAGMTYREIPKLSEFHLSDIAWSMSPLNRHMSRDGGSSDAVDDEPDPGVVR